jgi:hypothetical protein
MQQGSLPQFLSAESVTTAAVQMRCHAAQVRRRASVVWKGAALRGMQHSAEMSRLLRRCVANLRTPRNMPRC